MSTSRGAAAIRKLRGGFVTLAFFAVWIVLRPQEFVRPLWQGVGLAAAWANWVTHASAQMPSGLAVFVIGTAIGFAWDALTPRKAGDYGVRDEGYGAADD